MHFYIYLSLGISLAASCAALYLLHYRPDLAHKPVSDLFKT